MKVEFELAEKSFTSDDGQERKYYVLQRKLITGDILEIPIKKDKYIPLSMSLTIENQKR